MVKDYGEMIQVDCKKIPRTIEEWSQNKDRVFSSFFVQDISKIDMYEMDIRIPSKRFWHLCIRLKEDLIECDSEERRTRAYYHSGLNDSDANKVREWVNSNSNHLITSTSPSGGIVAKSKAN